jgi:hypothetical protein
MLIVGFGSIGESPFQIQTPSAFDLVCLLLRFDGAMCDLEGRFATICASLLLLFAVKGGLLSPLASVCGVLPSQAKAPFRL